MQKRDAHLLFVYGTLRSNADSPMSAFLRQEGEPLSQASCAGQLYNLGSYPGMVDASNSTDRVIGELWKLATPEHSLPQLDDYEGASQDPPLYLRVLREVTPIEKSDAPVQAWVYLYARPLGGAARIVSGDYFNR